MAGQTSYTNMAKAYAGMLSGYGDHVKKTAHNDLGSLPQIEDVVPVVANSFAYQFEVNGIPVQFTSDADATAAEIRDGLIDAFRAEPLLEDIASVNPSGNNVRVTAKTPGTAISVTESSANLSVSTVQANVAQAEIPFGRAVVARTGAGTTARSAHLPSADSQTFLGVSERVHSLVDPVNVGEGVAPGKAFPVVHRGAVWCETEEEMNPGDQVWFRHTANGALNQLGRFRTDIDTSNADQVTSARVLENAGPTLALIEFNLP